MNASQHMNPWSGRRKTAASTTPKMAGRWNPRSGKISASATERFVDEKGNIEASSRMDLARAIQTMLKVAAQPELIGDGNRREAEVAERNSYSVDPERIEAQLQMLRDSEGNRDAEMIIGETLGDSVVETMGRAGFTRNCLQLQNVAQGQEARWRIRRKDVIAHQITSSGQVRASEIRDYFTYPKSYQLTGAVLVEDKELEHSDSALLDEKFQDLLEQIWRQEDLHFKTLLDSLAPTINNVIQFNTFTPTTFTTLRTQIRQHSIPCTRAILAVDLWDDIIAGTDFVNFWDEVHKHELIENGSLGSILGVNLLTDGFRHAALRVLNDGECYFLGSPQTLGGIAQHGELKTRPTDRYNMNEAKRGWFFTLIESMVLLNARAISRGHRA